MGNRDDSMGSIANRIATWAGIALLGVYVLNMGQWVGAAEEKLEAAEKVQQQVNDIQDRVTRVEEKLNAEAKLSAQRSQAILKAIEKLEKKVEEDG